MALAAAGVLFGTTFRLMQSAIEDVEPVPLLGVRFTIGALALVPLARRRPAAQGEWRAGAVCGVALLAGYVLQTIGLQHTTTTRSAFITYLLVVIVPVLATLRHRRPPSSQVIAGVVVATAGLFLLTGRSFGLGVGEALTLVCAVAFAVHVMAVAEFAPRYDTVRLTAIQLAVVGIACLVPGTFLGGYAFSLRAWLAAVYCAIAVSSLAFLLMIWGQRHVGPTRASLLLMLEPVTAAIVGVMTGEALGAAGAVGAALILGGILVAEAPVGRHAAVLTGRSSRYDADEA